MPPLASTRVTLDVVEDPAGLLAELYGATTRGVEALNTHDFARPTRAAGWTVRDLLFHQLLDAQRALVAFASPADGPADVDEVTYWRDYRPGQGDWSERHARFVTAAAAAYESPGSLVDHWRTTSAAAVRAAGRADPAAYVATQGHVLAVPDFVSTLVVEAAVHLLDLTLDLPDAPTPSARALARVRRVLEGLYGGPLPSRWTDREAALKGTGRQSLGDGDVADLGPGRDRLPLLG